MSFAMTFVSALVLNFFGLAQSKEDVKSGFETHELKPRNSKIYNEDLLINGVKLDKRIAKYYKEEDFKEMDASKIKQLNYLYLKTFEVKDYEKLTDASKKFINEKFEVGPYEFYRKQSESVTVSVNAEGHSFVIILFSRDIILSEKNKIK